MGWIYNEVVIKHKLHCSNPIVVAVHKAIEGYKNEFREIEEDTFGN
jgi:hypothetical protein